MTPRRPAILDLLYSVRQVSETEWEALCPAHNDTHPSLVIGIGAIGKDLAHCRAGCRIEEVVAAAGTDMSILFPKLEARFEILDLTGAVVAVHVRVDSADGKKMWWEQPDGTHGLGGIKVADLPLYGIYERRDSKALVLVEGEKPVLTLDDLNIDAVGTVTGAAKTPSDESLKPLLGRTVVLWPDADEPGRQHMQRIAARLIALGHDHLGMVEWAEAQDGDDAADFVERGASAEQVLALLRNARPVEARAVGEPDAASPDTEPVREATLTDAGNAIRFVREHGDVVRYSYAKKTWLVFDRGRWMIDLGAGVMMLAKKTARRIYREAADEVDDDERDKIAAWARSSESEPRLKAMLALAQSEPGISVGPDELDSDPWLLNTPTGTVNLRDGSMRAHDRADMITKMTAAEYEPGATHPVLDAYLARMLPSAELRAYVQRALGYAATGCTDEECLFFLYGPTAGGKSTLLGAVRKALGDYGATADFTTFTEQRRRGGAASEDLARLEGKRFVSSIEVKDGARLATGVIKWLTGGDIVAARGLFQSTVEYTPQFTLFLAANDQPPARDDDDALWRRVKVVPFTVALPPTERDPGVKLTLCNPKDAGPAVLAWVIAGSVAWGEAGLGEAPEVEAATADYRSAQDPIADFINARMVLEADAWISSADLRREYEEWGREEGARQLLSGKELAGRLKKLGCLDGKRQSTRGWVGICSLRSTTQP